MKPPFRFYPILLVFMVLAFGQFACSVSGLSTVAASALATANAMQTNQPPASAQATQPPASTQATQPPTSATPAHGTPAEAIAMLQEAVAHYNAVGRTQALADFTNRVAPFFDRDLYVACIDSNLVQSANGGYPNLVGSPIEPISRAAWDAATTNKIDSIDYMWLDPATGATAPKTFYYEKVGSDVCGVGAYHP
jgi:hypothetical protein